MKTMTMKKAREIAGTGPLPRVRIPSPERARAEALEALRDARRKMHDLMRATSSARDMESHEAMCRAFQLEEMARAMARPAAPLAFTDSNLDKALMERIEKYGWQDDSEDLLAGSSGPSPTPAQEDAEDLLADVA